MQFRSCKDIESWLIEEGYVIFKKGNSYKYNQKTGETLDDVRPLTDSEVSALYKIIKNSVVNPFIFNNNFRILFKVVDLQIIERYNRRENLINKLERDSKRLKGNETYVYVKENGNYYKVQNGKLRKKGIFIIDKNLIPDKAYQNIEVFNYRRELDDAFNYKGKTNKYKESFDKEKEIFNNINICEY